MKSAQAWIMGLAALGVMGALTLPYRLSSMQGGLQTLINKQLSDPAYDGVVALASGQEATVYLSEDYKGSDGPAKLKAAQLAVSNLKGLEGLTKQGGWLYGPMIKVAIAEDRVSIPALEADKGVSLHLTPVPASTASAQSASSGASETSLSAPVDDALVKCNSRLQDAMDGRLIDFKADGVALTADSNEILDDLAAALRTCPASVKLSIDGLLQQGEASGTKGGAYQRAQAVADALVLRGYDPYHLSVGTVASEQAHKDGQRGGRQVAVVAMGK